MGLVQVKLCAVIDIGTNAAVQGTARAGEAAGVDDLFELIVGIATLIHAIAPGG